MTVKCVSISAVLDEPNHCPVAADVELVEVVVLNLGEHVELLLVGWLSSDFARCPLDEVFFFAWLDCVV